jgi:hypothetical protein
MSIQLWAFCAGLYLTAVAAISETENDASFVVFRLIPFVLGMPMLCWATVGLFGRLP